MTKQRALGMGLQALIASASTTSDHAAPKAAATEALRLDEIDVNPYQPRSEFDDAALQDLAASIRLLGVIQPVTVCRQDNGRYRLISGERRYRASKMAGLETIPAYIRPGSDDREMLLMALEENVQREDLDAIEIALAYRRLTDEFGYTQEELGATVQKKRSTVANFLRLLKLPPEIQFAIRQKAISTGHAKVLVNIQDPIVQLQLLDEIIRKDLSVRATEQRAAQIRNAAGKPAGKTPAAAWMQEAQRYLSGRLGTSVHVKSNAAGDAGSIVINFASKEELQQIVNQLQQ